MKVKHLRSARSESFAYCTFCQKEKKYVQGMLRSVGYPYNFICSSCIEDCIAILTEERPAEDPHATTLRPPSQIKQFLDQYVVGQDLVKTRLAVAVYNHYKRRDTMQKAAEKGVELKKHNILLAGSTGVGKTELARSLAKMLGVPFTIVSAKGYTEAGYVGKDVEEMFGRLLSAADGKIEDAEWGIIFIDEVDKVGRAGKDFHAKDISGEGVQQSLLKYLEGAEASIPAGKHVKPDEPAIKLDTSNILFICAGAFVGLENIIRQRLEKKAPIGFSTAPEKAPMPQAEVLDQSEPEDFVNFGLIPEFIGRMPVRGCLHDLTNEHLTRILVEPKNNILAQYQFVFAEEGVELAFTKDALVRIAELAAVKKTGARGLESVLEKMLNPVQFALPEMDKRKNAIITVTREMVDKGIDLAETEGTLSAKQLVQMG